MKKRLLSMILAISMMLTILPVNAITAWAADDKSGVCGDGLTYTMIQNGGTDTYTLAITKSGTGTGEMTDYSYSSGYNPVPWYAECDKITKLTIAGATSIGKSAFEYCHRLADVTISGSVTSIGEQAFEGCQALTNTSISNILKEATSIGEGAFRGCTSLTSVEIPKSVTSIGVAAFGQCSNLTSVKILGTITSIAASTFVNCGKLTNFDIPVSVTSIGDWAFARCSGLAGIKIPEKVTSIGNHAFENCTSLTTIKIPDSVTSIGENAFNGCSSLRQVDLPSVIPTISQGAFNNANTRFYYPGYAKDFNAQVGQIATGNIGMQTYRVCCYRDVFFDANGGSFADSSTRKKVEKIWRETKLTQVQVDSIGAPKQSGKIFLGWNTTANATTTINPIYGDTADGTIYYAVYKDAVPAAVTIDGLDGTTVKAGEAKEFTVNATPNDDANTGAKATITVSGANAGAVEKIQYKDGGTWKDVPDEGLSIDAINNTEFKLITKADANNGDVTITVTAKKADGTEIDKKVAAVTVTKKEEPVTPGGGSTGSSENPGENPGGDSGNTNPTPKPDEKPDRKIKIDGGIVEVNGKEVKPDEDGNITVKKGDEITITVDKSKISDAQVFDQWVIKPDSVLNEVDPKSEKISFTMPAEDVTIEAMTRDASIVDDDPGVLGTGALIATGVVGSAALLYQGHMLGTELYLRYLLPHGAVIPQNRAELAVLLWQDAENPEPVSTTLYSDISDEDSAIQQAARWAVENDLMEQLDAEEHPDHFDPFVPVTFSDSIRAWKKAQELKK